MGETLLKYCHIHATSEQEKRDILTIVQPKSIRVIPNLVSLGSGARASEYHASVLKDEKSPVFKMIFLSRIEEKKGLELLFEALTLVHIPWQLSIGGTGKEEYIQNLKDKTEKLNLSERINWLGLVSNEDKFNLMAKHDLTALTSYNENFANVVVESLSVGTPVLISKFVGLADYVADKNLGWITGLDIEEIKTEIIQAYQDIEKRKKIRTTAPLQINTDFNDGILAKQYVELYKEILTTSTEL
jgi:glycosyltransferase involved in cell wall biosynthesis